jgi:hypothetical protein
MQRLVLQVQREHEAASTSVDVDGSLVRTKRFSTSESPSKPGPVFIGATTEER